MRKTKIVCTLGPATDNPEILKELMKAGMNVARINFSHGNYQDQEQRINVFKWIRGELGLPIPLLLDTQGPEIRIGKFDRHKVLLENGKSFTLLNEDILGDETKVSITYKELYKDVEIGKTILINDGTIELKVKEILNKNIICEIIQGGYLTNRKSINIPDLALNLPSITQKDIEDIKYGIIAGFDYIAASFVRKPEDVLAIKEVLIKNNGEHIKVISKIENREGIDNFDEILNVSDGIMVARGDLGVEIPMEEVPIYQKQFIKKTYKQGKPVITATQMLESMITNSKPTRAEVSDIANAIYDGSGSIMLSRRNCDRKVSYRMC
ncbi:MAG: pyruvate kinase [Clostridia bacterium]|nr:pyruvate kinase [Clostridia bacterium]